MAATWTANDAVVAWRPARCPRHRIFPSARSAASPFGKGASSSSKNSSPFGGTATTSGGSPFGGGGGAGQIADPFAVAAAPSVRRKQNPAADDSGASRRKQEVEYLPWADVRVFEVPPQLRRQGKEVVTEHVTFFGLEELFPETGLQEVFNSNSEFRTGIRQAMRDDLFVADDSMSDAANASISSLSSSLMVNWKNSKTGYAALSELFSKHGVTKLSGESFIQTLGGLCGAESHGSLIDITSTGRRQERHSWHQDSGLEKFTVMLGFPPESNWEGVGVFSHSVKLSHRLRQDGEEGQIIEWEDFMVGDELPVEVIGRPEFRAGQEVMVYCDATHIHSAPDMTQRESVWRFM